MKTLGFATALLAVVSAHKLGDSTRIRGDGRSAQTHARVNNGDASLFPFLTKLRDGAVELLFGRHPAKDGARSAASIESLRNRYANELVVRFNISDSEEERALAEASNRLFLDVWAVNRDYVDIRLHSSQISPLIGLLPKRLQTSHFTLISDLPRAIYNSLPKDERSHEVEAKGMLGSSSSPLAVSDNVFFQKYHPLNVVKQWMQLMESMFPDLVEYISIGLSSEGREIPAFRIGSPSSDTGSGPRKTMVVTAGLHAREWISTTTANYLAWGFITEFNNDPLITKFLHHFDIIFIPSLNPDGMEFSWQTDRLWRKSRQNTSLRMCKGYDLDRSFSFGVEFEHVQNDPCSEDYGGEQPFEATEAAALAQWARNQVKKRNVQFVGMVDFHSYSQQILFPYAYTCTVEPPNLENLEELAAGIAKTIRLSSGEFYSVSPACDAAMVARRGKSDQARVKMNEGAGSAMDWFYQEMNAHFSYQIKLRDHGLYGFLLPEEEIIPTGQEMLFVMKYVADYLLGNNGIEVAAAEGGADGPSDEHTTNQELRRRRMRR